MLKYHHIYNLSNPSLQYSIHDIEASPNITSVAVLINNVFHSYVVPNHTLGSGIYNFNKYFSLGTNILELLHSGSTADYVDIKIQNSVFNDRTFIYVKNLDGDYLHRTATSMDSYEWSETEKTKFFFNPYFWDSEYLWKQIFGYVPSGITTTGQWPTNYEIEFFSKRTLEVDISWPGEQVIDTVEPAPFDYFSNNTSGELVSFSLSHLIDLPLKYGDTIDFYAGAERLSVTYKPLNNHKVSINNLVMPQAVSLSISRPVVHLSIEVIQPNRVITFSKGLSLGENNFTVSIEGTDYPIQVTTSASPSDLVFNDLVELFDSQYEHIVEGI